jgi:hypothetical protein
MGKKDINIRFKRDFKIIQQLINLLDPCGLIKGGAPLDEYDCLTTLLLGGLYQGKSNQEIADLIINELDHHFGAIYKSKINDSFKLKLDRFIDEIKTKIG